MMALIRLCSPGMCHYIGWKVSTSVADKITASIEDTGFSEMVVSTAKPCIIMFRRLYSNCEDYSELNILNQSL